MKLAFHVEWIRDCLPILPDRLHVRGVWVAPAAGDRDDGHGSEIGSPALASAFRKLIEEPFALRVEAFEGEPCVHPTLSEARVEQLRVTGDRATDCETCEGSGLRSGTRVEYSSAYEAAMQRLQGMGPWHPGGPTHHTIVNRLVQTGFDFGLAQRGLQGAWSCVAIDSHFLRHVHRAAHTLYRVYSEVEIPRPPKPAQVDRPSESQSIAEAAA